jgi:hypothetical protein
MGITMTEPPSLSPVDRPARRRPSLARIAAGLVLLLAAGLVAGLAWDDARTHRQAAEQARRADGLGREVAAARVTNDQLSTRVGALQAENGRLQDAARSPTLTMWNACAGPCVIGPNAVRVGSVPDTFQLLLTFTADVPVRAYVFTFHQWTEYDRCGFDVGCVTGAYQAYDPATSVDTAFAEAEGCSGYVWVLRSDRDGTITPNVRVRYLPAPNPTGVCASG